MNQLAQALKDPKLTDFLHFGTEPIEPRNILDQIEDPLWGVGVQSRAKLAERNPLEHIVDIEEVDIDEDRHFVLDVIWIFEDARSLRVKQVTIVEAGVNDHRQDGEQQDKPHTHDDQHSLHTLVFIVLIHQFQVPAVGLIGFFIHQFVNVAVEGRDHIAEGA